MRRTRKKITPFLILLFIPVIVVILIIRQNMLDDLETGEILECNIFFSENEKKAVTDRENMDFLISVVENGIQIDEAAGSPERYTAYKLEFVKLNITHYYTLMLTPSPSDCLFTDEEGTLYRIPVEFSEKLLAFGGIEERLIGYLKYPALNITSGSVTEKISGAVGTWYSVRTDGQYGTTEVNEPSSAEFVLPYSDGKLALDFAIVPDFCRVTVKNAENSVIFEGDRAEFSAFDFSLDTYMDITVKCEWYDESSQSYRGNIEYSAKLFYDVPASCTVSSDSLKTGDMIVAEIKNSSSEGFAVTGLIVSSFETVGYGNEKLIFIKLRENAASGSYRLQILGTDLDFSKDVSFENVPARAIELSKTDSEAILSFLSEMKSSDIIRADGFDAPCEKYNALVPFGTYSTNGTGMLDYDYCVTSAGETVKSASGGACVFAGRLDNLKNTVIIDHGLGIYTVYAELSDIAVTPNTQADAGAAIGTSGGAFYFGVIVRGAFVRPSGVIGTSFPFV